MKKNIPNTCPHCYAHQKPRLQQLHFGQGCICCGLAKRCRRAKYQIPNTNPGFTLIELLVSIFIFSLITVAIVSVFVSTTKAHQKARAIKFVKENAEFAISSIAKDVRMGKIEGKFRVGSKIYTNNGTQGQYFVITRNRTGETICYSLTEKYLGEAKATGLDYSFTPPIPNCPSAPADYKKLIDLTDTGMKFGVPAP
jgi:prepilin-type N-terminal cleavage/methylation domain-containing protein